MPGDCIIVSMKEVRNNQPALDMVYREVPLCPFLSIAREDQTPRIMCRDSGLTLNTREGFIGTIPNCRQVREGYGKEGCLKGKIPYREKLETIRIIP